MHPPWIRWDAVFRYAPLLKTCTMGSLSLFIKHYFGLIDVFLMVVHPGPTKLAGGRKNQFILMWESCHRRRSKLKPVSLLSTERIQRYSGKKKEILDSLLGNDRFLSLELYWDYNGEAITTSSIVSEKTQKIIYDDILSNVSYYSIDSSSATKLPAIHDHAHRSSIDSSSDLKQLGNHDHTQQLLSNCGDSECDNMDCQGDGCDDYLCVNCVCYYGMVDGPVSYYDRSATLSEYNIWGNEAAEAYYWFKVTGERCSGIIELIDYNYYTHYWSEPGFSADAQFEVHFFEPGHNGFVEYSYVVMVGEESNLTIQIGAGGWTLPSGCQGITGGGTVHDDDLE